MMKIGIKNGFFLLLTGGKIYDTIKGNGNFIAEGERRGE